MDGDLHIRAYHYPARLRQAEQEVKRVTERLEAVQMAVSDPQNLTPGEWMAIDLLTHAAERAVVVLEQVRAEGEKLKGEGMQIPKQVELPVPPPPPVPPGRKPEQILKELGF